VTRSQQDWAGAGLENSVQCYEIEVRLMPQATCALSLKIMSVLHARAVELRSFSFVRREGHASAASIRVSSSAARLATLVATLDQVVGVVEITHSRVEVDHPDPRGTP
jgi:hypothetical protein